MEQRLRSSTFYCVCHYLCLYLFLSVSVCFCLCVYMCFCFPMCVTDQCAESLRWVSTGDPRGVNSDLHHLLHVGRWRLTCVELPAWPCLWATQRPTHIKLTSRLTLAQHWHEEEEEEEEGEGHGGLTVRQTESSSGSHISTGSVLSSSLQTCGCHG